MDIPDHQVIQEVKSGNKQAYAILVRKYKHRLYRLAYRLCGEGAAAEDVLQESLSKAYFKLSTFEGRSSFKSWIYQITLNTAKNWLRSRKFESLEESNKVPLSSQCLEQDLNLMYVNRIFSKEISMLPDRQKEALILRIYEDLDFKEVAEIMGCPYDTAKANYRHGLMNLKKRLKKENLLQDFLQLKTQPPMGEVIHEGVL